MNLNGIFIIPTGYRAFIGGDAGANPQVKLIANCTKNLLVNANAVNASDVNEMSENCWYTEGSAIDRFLEGSINLQKPKTYNKILMAVNKINPFILNSANQGRWGLGAKIEIVELEIPLLMHAFLNEDGSANGTYSGVDELVDQLSSLEYDALALQTPITCDEKLAETYFHSKGNICNPWGMSESLTSHAISEKLNKPVAHAPSESVDDYSNMYLKEEVYYQMAPEIVSKCYMFCVFKGLLRAPKLLLDLNERSGNVLTNRDIDFLMTPHGLFGRPHHAATKLNIPIIVVKENTTCYSEGYVYPHYKNLLFAENYLEAAGMVMSLESGVDIDLIKLKK